MPSPALMTDSGIRLAAKAGAPDAPCRMTKTSGFMARKVRIVSLNDSPFATLLEATAMLDVSALRILAAISNEVLVRVLAS